MSQPLLAHDLAGLRSTLGGWRRDGLTIGFVPTMGALHEGHLALVRHALASTDRTVVSIFVNPTQFGPGEDLDRYPRDEAGDLAKLADLGTHLVWLPPVAVMYPPGHQTFVTVEDLGRGLCADTRPHFFRGVATVVTKLLIQVQPDLAVFGEKDYQQLLVVRQLVRDLSLATRIEGRPTVREPDGLAMSSRNVYLSAADRRKAPRLHATLEEVRQRLELGRAAAEELAGGRARLLEAGFDRIDYLELRDAADLGPLARAGRRPARLLAAVWLGRTRLIDNVPVGAITEA